MLRRCLLRRSTSVSSILHRRLLDPDGQISLPTISFYRRFHQIQSLSLSLCVCVFLSEETGEKFGRTWQENCQIVKSKIFDRNPNIGGQYPWISQSDSTNRNGKCQSIKKRKLKLNRTWTIRNEASKIENQSQYSTEASSSIRPSKFGWNRIRIGSR